MNELLLLSAARLIDLMKSGEVSPVEVVKAHIARIEDVNPRINAVAIPLFEQALAQAQQSADQWAHHRDDLPALFGLPVTIKDALAVAGARFTAGVARYADRVAPSDAEAVRRLKSAGAIIMGKTNHPAMSSSTETDNFVFGLTRNPWNPERSAGGSSGGEGAIIAAGGSPLGLGSDIAGSIRIPAAFNGVAGLKPTGGRVPSEGHEPIAPPPFTNWNTIGPLARRIEDLSLALSVLSDTPVLDYYRISLSGRRVVIPGYMPLAWAPSREAQHHISLAADILRSRGMEVCDEVRLPMVTLVCEWAGIMTRDYMPHLMRELGSEGRPANLFGEAVRRLVNKHHIPSGAIGLSLMGYVMGLPVRLLGYGSYSCLDDIRRQIIDVLKPSGVMLWPAFPTVAPRHGHAWWPGGSPVYTAIFNPLGFPAVVVPVGFSEDGLPLGVQIIALPGEDEMALAVASVLEEACGGWQIAP